MTTRAGRYKQASDLADYNCRRMNDEQRRGNLAVELVQKIQRELESGKELSGETKASLRTLVSEVA
jgi:hypothetical protein